MSQIEEKLMLSPDDDKFAPALWAGAGAVAFKVISWIHSRLLVPRDSLQQKILEDMAEDVAWIKAAVEGQAKSINENSVRIARLEGRTGK
jgi:hypothetical protein